MRSSLVRRKAGNLPYKVAQELQYGTETYSCSVQYLVVLGQPPLRLARLGLERVLSGLVTFLQSDTDFIARGHGSATGKMIGRYYGQVLVCIYTAFSAFYEDDII